jgi:predicted lipoprotein with Yx(FWY)xxD motif
MSPIRTLKTALAVALCAAATAQAALAAGEPKNTPPFTRPISANHSGSLATIHGSRVSAAWTAVAGDAKNLRPFTRSLAETDGLARYLHNREDKATSAAIGEPKNEFPFISAATR